MASRAFIVKLELDSFVSPSEIAEDLFESLIQDNFQVIDVAPWASPADVEQQALSLGLPTQLSEPSDTPVSPMF